MKKEVVIVRFLPFFIGYAIISYASSMPASDQSLIPLLERLLPNEAGASFVRWIRIPYWDTVVSVEERGFYPFVEFLIRKGTHIMTFGLLALSARYATRHTGWALALTIGAACIDEWHQSFVPGRTGSVEDVAVDTFGALLALGAYTFLPRNRKRTNDDSS